MISNELLAKLQQYLPEVFTYIVSLDGEDAENLYNVCYLERDIESMENLYAELAYNKKLVVECKYESMITGRDGRHIVTAMIRRVNSTNESIAVVSRETYAKVIRVHKSPHYAQLVSHFRDTGFIAGRQRMRFTNICDADADNIVASCAEEYNVELR